jgi:hypothetical protein
MFIIFSLTAHENLECLFDLLDNIKKCFVNYDILILLSITENLYNEKLKEYDFVKCVTIRPNNYASIWGNIDLFNQHILNMKYIYDNSIDYDYFWFVASNEMFIKIIPPDFLNNYAIKIENKSQKNNDLDYDIYFNDLMNKSHDWYWIDLAKKDKNLINYLYANKFVIYRCDHEGLVLSRDIILEIYNEYNNNKLHENSTFKDYVMEEIFISTYLRNRYQLGYLNIFCCRYKLPENVSHGDNFSYEIIENNLECHHASIKPVMRIYNNQIREHIRNKIM